MTADERINELLARAGSPVMVVRNTQEDEQERKEDIMRYARIVADRDFGGSVALYIRHLADTIDRLEAALNNVIGEREQLKRELYKEALRPIGTRVCFYCKHEDKSVQEEPCNTCVIHRENPCFEWHGVKEEAQNAGDA